MLELHGISLRRAPIFALAMVLLSHVRPESGLAASNPGLEVHMPQALENATFATPSITETPPTGTGQLWRRLAVTMGPLGLGLGVCAIAFHLRERRRYRELLSRVRKDLEVAGESERVRIARELHDGVCQWLAVSKHSFERAVDTANASDPNSVQHLRRGLGNLEECIREIRRISHDLKPALPEDQPFVEALSNLVHEFAASAQIEVKVHGLDAGKGEQLSPRTQFALYRTAQEALMNIDKHAKASQIALALKEAEKQGQVTLAILDNGSGIRRVRANDGCRAGIGMSNMRERVAEVGGALTVRSSAKGTEIIARVPTMRYSSAAAEVEGNSDPGPVRFLQDEAPA